MPDPAPSRPIAIVGPTATGKTSLAEYLALARSGEIVTADSMQVYRGMDIGTAKVPKERRRVPHHCLDLVDPGQPYSAALFQHDARRVIDELLARNTLPILAGGTGLYVRAALDEMSFPSGEVSSETRLRLEEEARTQGVEALHTRLAELDPDSAALIHPNNVRRTIRALEMAEQGVSYSAQAAQFAERVPHYDALYLGLDLDRGALYERIERRVDRMLDDGLLEEVAQLLDRGFRDALTSAQAIGYKEFVPVVEKETDVATAASEVKKATRRYAKRQLTWFRRDPRVNWIDVGGMTPEDIASAATALIESSERREPRR
jgi:tRNA dimethylallyltransferase